MKTLWVMGQLALQKAGLRRYAWLESRLEDVIGKDVKARIFRKTPLRAPGKR